MLNAMNLALHAMRSLHSIRITLDNLELVRLQRWQWYKHQLGITADFLAPP